MANENRNQADGPQLDEKALQNRTSASRPRSCTRCGRAVTGRRRNGYCSDRCRMQDRREERRRERDALLDTVAVTVQKLRKM